MPETPLLTVDAGNSRLKWAIYAKTNLLSSGVADHGSWQTAARVLDALVPRLDIAEVRLSCVANPRRLDDFVAHLISLGPRHIRLARSVPAANGIRNGYLTAHELGVDRWLAVLAAAARHPGPLVVVDAGTALTIDIVASTGQHLGGYIVPGLRTMLRSLGKETDGVRVDGLGQVLDTTPQCTSDAVGHGIVEAALGLIERIVTRRQRNERAPPTIVLTGGDAEHLVYALPTAHWHRHLVLEGLRLAPDDMFEDVHPVS